MKNSKIVLVSAVVLLLVVMSLFAGCTTGERKDPQSVGGITISTVQVPVGSDGLTTEQRNIGKRLKEDNQPGSIKHLYVISAYSGQVLLYSTVDGKVTSSGKRISPTSVLTSGDYNDAIPISISKNTYYTGEVLQDDGTYGNSIEYLYWWDTKGVYHQHYVTGGQILHVSNQPISVKSIVINLETNSLG